MSSVLCIGTMLSFVALVGCRRLGGWGILRELPELSFPLFDFLLA